MFAKRPRALFFALAFVVMTTLFPYIGAVNNPNENVRTFMTMALAENHTFRIDSIVARHGWSNDMARAPDKKTGEFHLYSLKAPGVSYAGVPVYWAFTKLSSIFHYPPPDERSSVVERMAWLRRSTLVLRLFVIQIPCFGFLLWFERWLRIISSDIVLRLCAVAAAGFGTNYLGYSMMFASHAPFAIAAFGSFAISTSERLGTYRDSARRRGTRAFWAGFLAGLATLLEYHALPVSAALALYALFTFWRPRQLIGLILGGAVPTAAMMFFQWRAFGNPLTPGHKMAATVAYAALHSQGLFGLEKPDWHVAAQLSFSRTFGFFGTSPFMCLGLFVIPFGIFWAHGPRAYRNQMRFSNAFWIVLMAILWTTVSAATNWRGGWTIGPRYLGAAPPFFALGATFALEHLATRSRLRRAIARGVAGGLALASMAQLGLVALVYNALPEDIIRPVPEFAIPFIRVGFVPHHAAEVFGWKSRTFWYVVAACFVLAGLIVTLWPRRDRAWAYALRVVLVIGFTTIGLRPAFGAPSKEEEGDGGERSRRGLAVSWEPDGRDRISELRVRAERSGPREPCLWFKLADFERMVGWQEYAARDAERARAPRSACP